jgi:methionyl-tRNA formyltransferase
MASTGQVIHVQHGDLVVNCGQNTSLRLLEVQPEARKRMSVRDFMNGVHVKIGDRFG